MSSKKPVKKLRSLAELSEATAAVKPKVDLKSRTDMIKAGIKKRKPVKPNITLVTKTKEQPVVEPEVEIIPPTEPVEHEPTTETVETNIVVSDEAPTAEVEATVEDGNSSVETSSDVSEVVEIATEFTDAEIAAAKARLDERNKIIEQLLEFDSGDKRVELLAIYSMLPTERLEEQLNLLQVEWGGSSKMKASVEAATKLFKSATNSRGNKAKHSLLSQKYKEYNLLAQKVEKALGFDTVINGLKLTSYQNMLKTMISHHTALSQGVREMAEMIAFQYPAEDEEASNEPVPANTIEMLRILLSVGVSAKNWMLTANQAVSHNNRLTAENALLVKELKQSKEALKDAQTAFITREEEIRKQQHARFGAQYVLVNSAGQFLGVDEDAESINPKVLRFVDKLEHALTFKKMERLNRLIDSLRRWSKKDSKYVKIMHKRGFRPDNLTTAVVTLTRV